MVAQCVVQMHTYIWLHQVSVREGAINLEAKSAWVHYAARKEDVESGGTRLPSVVGWGYSWYFSSIFFGLILCSYAVF